MKHKEDGLFQIEEQTKIWLFAGSDSDLTKLNFSILNLKFYKVDSQEFLRFLKKTNHLNFKDHNNKLFEKYNNNPLYKDHLYALVPISFAKKSDQFYTVRTALLVLFPSDITLVAEIGFQLFDKKYLYWNSYGEWQFNPTGKTYRENFLVYPQRGLKQINEFLQLFINRYENLPYLKTCVSSYVSSFFEFPRMEFLSLCISMESIISGTSELVYRIKRNVAIICGETKFDSEIIFNNVGKIYQLRSEIVHGEDIKYKKLQSYLPYLQSLISRLIIELITLNISTKKTLNETLTGIGYGDKKKLVNNYKIYYFNTSPLYKIIQPIS